MTKGRLRFGVLVGTFLLAQSYLLSSPPELDSAAMQTVRDTLQTSRLSVNARVKASGTVVGSSKVMMYNSASAPANTISTANLRIGDSLVIGVNTYTVTSIIDADEFTVTPVLISGDTDDGDAIYLKTKAQHVVTFNTANAFPNGYFRILIPADATTPNDGNPDDQGWDFGGGTITVTGTNATGYTFVTGVATASGGSGCTSPSNYHCFEVHYSGNGGIGTAITISIGQTGGTNTLINPGPGTAHTEATADTYTYIVRNYDSADTLQDATSGKIGVIESVRVTATVDPTITFSIAGVAASQSKCGETTTVSTAAGTNAPLAVPFGTLSLNTFAVAAHDLTVSTNAENGYSVTAIENDQLGKDGGTTPRIVDTPCDAGPCTDTAEQIWATATNNGFGYSLENVDAASITFEHGGTRKARQFPAAIETETPATLFSSTAVANAEDAYICYKVSVGATQAAGDYENQITYTATASF